MTEAHLVDFKGWQNQNKLIAASHCFKLHILELSSKFDCSVGVDVNHHQLIGKMIMEVGKVCKLRGNFYKVANSYQLVNSQAI